VSIDIAAEHYVMALRAAAKEVVQNTSDRARADFLPAAKSGGWIYAGTWYNHITKMNDVMQSTLNSLPTSEPISIDNGQEVETALIDYTDAMTIANEYIKNRTAAVKSVYYQETNVRAPQDGEGLWEYVRKLISAPFMGAINQMTEEIAGSNLNHMSQMKSFGDTIITTGWGLLTAMATAAGTASSWVSQATAKIAFDAGAAISMLGGVMTFFAIMLWGMGIVLSIYAPMIPFLTWIASVINWFVLLIEAVLAAPIWAVAHIHPDGEDAVGRGGMGYGMILSLVMRPALMLFGLVAAMLLTQPISALVNASFMSAISGVQADSTTGIISFFGFVGVYCILMTTLLHTAFSLIHWIPDNVPRWIGVAVTGGPASPDQKEHESHQVFAGGISRIDQGIRGGGKKREKESFEGNEGKEKGSSAGKEQEKNLEEIR
jgi:conjugal transfer/type IV secretion protein DotA/TraY